jgi:hypothetical protein
LAQPLGERGRGGPDDGSVHPVRAGTDRAAQPGGPEVQPVSETVTQFRLGVGFSLQYALEEIPQLILVPGVGIVGDPPLYRCPEVLKTHGSPPR